MNLSLQDKPRSNQMADSRFPTAVISHFYSAVYHGRMKKDSNRKVNWVLIQTAHVAVLYDGRMRDYYGRMKKTHHSSIAITHVANKMIKIIWHMLTSRDLYRDRNEKLYQKKLKRIDAAV